jgi:hypothetical protein
MLKKEPTMSGEIFRRSLPDSTAQATAQSTEPNAHATGPATARAQAEAFEPHAATPGQPQEESPRYSHIRLVMPLPPRASDDDSQPAPSSLWSRMTSFPPAADASWAFEAIDSRARLWRHARAVALCALLFGSAFAAGMWLGCVAQTW